MPRVPKRPRSRRTPRPADVFGSQSFMMKTAGWGSTPSGGFLSLSPRVSEHGPVLGSVLGPAPSCIGGLVIQILNILSAPTRPVLRRGF